MVYLINYKYLFWKLFQINIDFLSKVTDNVICMILNNDSVTLWRKIAFPLKTLQNILNLKQKQKNESDYSPGFWIIEVWILKCWLYLLEYK